MTAVRLPWKLGLVTVTVTPGSNPPEVSVTVPTIAPVFIDVCANPKLGTSRSAMARDSNVNRENFVIYCPPMR